MPVRVGCWLCRGYGNTAAAINPQNIQPAVRKRRSKSCFRCPNTGGSGRAQLLQCTGTLLDKAPIFGAGCPAVQEPRNGARLREVEEQKVAASESRQEHLVTKVKTSLPDRVGWLLPGEARDFLPTSHHKG